MTERICVQLGYRQLKLILLIDSLVDFLGVDLRSVGDSVVGATLCASHIPHFTLYLNFPFPHHGAAPL